MLFQHKRCDTFQVGGQRQSVDFSVYKDFLVFQHNGLVQLHSILGIARKDIGKSVFTDKNRYSVAFSIYVKSRQTLCFCVTQNCFDVRCVGKRFRALEQLLVDFHTYLTRVVVIHRKPFLFVFLRSWVIVPAGVVSGRNNIR